MLIYSKSKVLLITVNTVNRKQFVCKMLNYRESLNLQYFVGIDMKEISNCRKIISL